MDDSKAKKLLSAERHRVEGLLKGIDVAGVDDRTAADQEGEMYDSAEPLTTEGTDDAGGAGPTEGGGIRATTAPLTRAGTHDGVGAELEERLAAIGRAEQRVEAGSH